MIDYDSFSRCHLTDSGSKRVKGVVNYKRLRNTDLEHLSGLVSEFPSFSIVLELLSINFNGFGFSAENTPCKKLSQNAFCKNTSRQLL